MTSRLATAVAFSASLLSAQAQDDYVLPSGADGDYMFAVLRMEFAKSARGAELLDFADSAKVAIAYDSTRSAIAHAPVSYDARTNTVLLKPAMPLEEECLRLGEGLRRAWQNHALNHSEIEDTTLIMPRQRWALKQIGTADALAYSSLIWAERLNANKIPMDQPVPRFGHDAFEIAQNLRAEINGDGLSLGEYRKIALKPAFRALAPYFRDNLEAYNEERIDNYVKLRALADAADLPTSTMDSLATLRDSHVEDAKFTRRFIRQMGGMSLETDAKTAWSRAHVTKMVKRKPYKSVPDRAGFREAQQEFHNSANDLENDLKRKVKKYQRQQKRLARKAP